MSKCETCYNKQYGYICDGCKHDPDALDKYIPMTNADKIRAMSDEELAHWICKRLPNCSAESCPGAELCNGTDGLSNGLVKWLQQPFHEIPDGQSGTGGADHK